MSLPSGAVLAPGEFQKIEKALESLAKDAHAPREISAKLVLHIHNEYPKLLYKGKKSVQVANSEEEEQATNDGFGAFVPEQPKEGEE